MQNSLLSEALKYASIGIAVAPIHNFNKHISISGGWNVATTDLNIINGMFSSEQFGQVTGIAIVPKKSTINLIVIDVDKHNYDGAKNLEALEQEFGKLPDDWLEETTTGGKHLFFRTKRKPPENLELAKGIDLLAFGNHSVTVAPSKAYKWSDNGVNNQDIGFYRTINRMGELPPYIPDIWEEKIFELSRKKRAYSNSDNNIKRTIEELEGTIGNRHDVLKSYIASKVAMTKNALSRSELLAILSAANNSLSTPITGIEYTKTVEPIVDWILNKENDKKAMVLDNGVMREKKECVQSAFDFISADDLQDEEIEPLKFIIDQILPEGSVGILAAPSKSFKSFMMLDAGISICNGRPFLNFKTIQEDVLYLDLESTKRRPKARMELILKGDRAPHNLYIANQSAILGEGFREQVDAMLRTKPNIKLIIVDMFKNIRPAAKKNVDGYDRDNADFGAIKQIAMDFNVSILLIMHTRKLKDSADWTNEILGSVGTMGSIDFAWGIMKEKRDDVYAKFRIIGKDIEEQCYEIEFSKKDYKWKMHGDSETIEQERTINTFRNNIIVKTVQTLLRTGNGKWIGSASDLIGASRYFESGRIYDDATKVGKFLNNSKDMFLSELSIVVNQSRTSKNRIYEIYYNTDYLS